MRKLLFLFACIFLASIGLVHAQSRAITGKVISADDGEPVVGASVMVKGTTTATSTNANGLFTLSVPQSGQTFVVSFVGMQRLELPISNNLVIKLEKSSSNLAEVMVVAYGTAKKSSFTGAASTIKAADLATRQVSNVTNALAGKMPGVQIVSSNGQPGSAATVRIRGIGSMSASNAPLYIVDGVPYDGTLSAINSNDIESLVVLKDAAASAIYGARGANGVILITTKTGSSKEAKITFDAKWGTNSRGVPNYEVMTDPAMYYETYYKGMYNFAVSTGKSISESHGWANSAILDKNEGGLGYQVYTVPSGQYFIGTNGKLNPNATLGYSDGEYYYTPDNWYDELFNKGNLRQEYNATVSGSSDKINYFFSAGYLNDEGIISGSAFDRFTVRSKVDYQAKKWLKIGSNMSYTNYDNQAPTDQTEWGSSGNLFYITGKIAPIYPMFVRNPDGTVKKDRNGLTVYDYGTTTNQARAFLGLSNPAIELTLDKHNSLTDVLTGKWYAIINLLEGLKFTANIASNVRNQRSSDLYNLFYGASITNQGDVTVSSYREVGVNKQFLATYAKSIDAHNFDLLVGYEDYKLKMQNLSGSNKMLYNPWIAELSNAIYSPATVTSSTDNYATIGLLGRVQYDYMGKYFASASFRRDGSSRFAPENRWGNFGSLGGSWLVTKEDFFSELGLYWLNTMKLKASYGIQGNDDLIYDGSSNYTPYLDQFKVYSNNGAFAINQYYKGNRDITWETSYSFNIGLEFEALDNRLTGSIDYFNKKTVDLLYYQPVPPSLGYSSVPRNVGTIVNQGLELDLNAIFVKTKDFNWSANFNATTYKNEIVKLASTVGPQGIKGTMTKYQVGGSVYDSYLREFAGVDDETGVSMYYLADGNGDYVLDSEGKKKTTNSWSAASQVNLGSTLAKVYGGFSTNIEYKGFDASASFSYQLGGRVYDFSYEELMHNGDQAGANWHKDILNAWSETNRTSNVPRLNNGDDSYQKLSSRFLTSSDYLSFNNLTLGYTIPNNLLKKMDVSSVRVFFMAENFGLLSARKGLDPRQSLGGTSYTSVGSHNYSAIRSLSGGISVNF